MKKEYKKPEMSIIEMQHQANILITSPGDVVNNVGADYQGSDEDVDEPFAR